MRALPELLAVRDTLSGRSRRLFLAIPGSLPLLLILRLSVLSRILALSHPRSLSLEFSLALLRETPLEGA